MTDITPPPIRTKQGSTKSKKLRLPCETCNNEWMGNNEERVKPILLPMMQGKSLILDVEKQTALAVWIAMKVMVIECHGQNHSVLTAAERLAMKERNAIPDRMRIQLLHCQDSEWLTRLEIHSAHVAHVPVIGTQPKNIQTVCFGFGEVYASTASVRGGLENLDSRLSGVSA